MFSVEHRNGIAMVTFNDANSQVNTLSSGLASVFDEFLADFQADESQQALVLLSAKPDSWIAGADIRELNGITSAMDGERISRLGQRTFDRLAAMSKPVVAAIHGACLGGGLELALACQWRVLTDHPKSLCALPEVQLGLIPGAGGTQRLPQLIGVRASLDFILTGKNIRPDQALRLGLVDDVVHPSILLKVAIERATQLSERKIKRKRRRKSFIDTFFDESIVGRTLLFKNAKKRLLARTKGMYPAPELALAAIEKGYSHGMTAGLEAEATAFGALVTSDVSRELIYIFQSTNELKKDKGVVDENAQARSVRRLGIIGAGFMGSGIASIAVQKQTQVRMQDNSMDRIAFALRHIRSVLKERGKKAKLSQLAIDDMALLASGTDNWSGLSRSDLIIEAVYEELSVKHDVLSRLDVIAPNAILATNTSTILVSRIAEASQYRERVVGMHFFSPVHKMPLVEVVASEFSSEEAIATAVRYGKTLGKTVIVVSDGPGFFVNRILAPYLNEAAWLLEEGVSADRIDDVLVSFGFPVGPFTLLDEVGLDVAGHSARVMNAALGERLSIPPIISRLIDEGTPGRKGGRGFYLYRDGERQGFDPALQSIVQSKVTRAISDEEILDRTLLPMLNEAVMALDEGILRCARDGDIGAVYGIGFPPFRGGPFRYMDFSGSAGIVQRLDELAARYPGRFHVSERLRGMAAIGERFHPPRAYG